MEEQKIKNYIENKICGCYNPNFHFCGLVNLKTGCEGNLERCIKDAIEIREKRKNNTNISCYKLNKGECYGCKKQI
ncbi:MAG: hypothetical protein QW117_01230 [Candidatus Pacearchaeota archaeon]